MPCERAGAGEEGEEGELICPPGLQGPCLPPLPATTPTSTHHSPTGKRNISPLSTNVDSQSVSQLVTIVPIHLGSLKLCNKSKLSQRFLLKYWGVWCSSI